MNVNPQAHIKILLIINFLFLIPPLCLAQLNPGDILFTGCNIDNPDEFSFMATTNISAGEIIYFTDRGFADENSSPGWVNTTEGIIKLTIQNPGFTTGDMIVIGFDGGVHIQQGLDIATVEDGPGSFSLAEAGDQIFAFQTSDLVNYTPSFIAGIHLNYNSSAGTDYGITDSLNWDNIASSYSSTLMSDLPDALTPGSNAILIEDNHEIDNCKYKNTVTQGESEEIKTAIFNLDDWFMHNTTRYSLGYPSTTSTITSGNWNSTSTWNTTNGIPGKITDVTISHDVAVTADCAADSIVVSAGASLEIQADETLTCSDTLTILSDNSNSGSLILDGSISGTVSYKRYMTGNKWHLLASPVSGQSVNDFMTNEENNIPINGSNYGIMDYNTSADGWNDFFTSSETGNFGIGNGYCVRRSSDGVVSFSGNAASGNINVTISESGNGWNLIGNPYPSSIYATKTAHSTDNFLTVNNDNLDPAYVALYVWDEQDGYSGSRNDYKIINNAGDGTLNQNYIQTGQGFFIKAKSGASSVSFTSAMRSHQPTIPLKSGEDDWYSLKLTAQSVENHSSILFYFNRNMTKGLDVGYDAGIFNSGSDFYICSVLPKDNGVDFAVQCLPTVESEELIVPLKVFGSTNMDFVLTMEENTLPDDVEIVLEDKATGNYTNLNKSNGQYTVTLGSDISERFYLHFRKLSTLSDDVASGKIQIIPNTTNNRIEVLGHNINHSNVYIFDIMGRQMIAESFNTNRKIISFDYPDGVYLMVVETGSAVYREKFIWNKLKR